MAGTPDRRALARGTVNDRAPPRGRAGASRRARETPCEGSFGTRRSPDRQQRWGGEGSPGSLSHVRRQEISERRCPCPPCHHPSFVLALFRPRAFLLLVHVADPAPAANVGLPVPFGTSSCSRIQPSARSSRWRGKRFFPGAHASKLAMMSSSEVDSLASSRSF